MSSFQRTASFLALGFALVAATASGSKSTTPYITFYNETTLQIGVTPDGKDPAIINDLSGDDLVNFVVFAGGHIINPGSSTTFQVQAGHYTLLASDWSDPLFGHVLYITEEVSVSGYEILRVYIKPDSSRRPAITFSATP